MENKHLFYLIHGLGGKPDHLVSLKQQLDDKLGDNTIVYIGKSNSGLNTMDGAVVGANRLLKELLLTITELAEDGKRVTQLSLIGYSFGGILARYLIGMLEELNFFNTVDPVIFTTFATPHVGSTFHGKSFRTRTLNFLGGKMLGLTGIDLFHRNNLLKELAEPDAVYMKGLKRFRHRMLFANAFYDRTVPFWTSYITTNNAFKKPSHLDLKYYDHLYGQPVNDEMHELGKIPFLVDLKDTTYLAQATSTHGKLSKRERNQRLLVGSLFPIFIPILVVLLTFGTLYARIKYGFFYKSIDHEHPVLFKKFQKISAKTSRRSSTGQDLDTKFNEEVASLAQDAVEDILFETSPRSDYINETVQPEQVVKGPPKPTKHHEGIVTHTPWEIDMDESIREAIDNLNTLNWDKYAVKLLHFNAHGEIVDRRRTGSQGGELMKYYATIAKNIVADEAQSRPI